jgi:putative toxin-antitoxin system antitoxin component (TIGR02293 family)
MEARTMTTAIDVLGGRKALSVRNELEFEELLRGGLPISAFEAMARRTAFARSDLERIVSRRTLGRSETRLTAEVSARLARFARVWALAEETFQDRDIARSWFFDSVPALGGKTPFRMLETETGALLVERVLVRLAYGVYS